MKNTDTDYGKGRRKALEEVKLRLEKEISMLVEKGRPEEKHELAYYKGLLSAYRRALHVVKGKITRSRPR